MSEVSFKSTFRIPVSQQGINNAKKIKLKSLLGSYPNSLVGTGTTGYARISLPNSKDENFLRKLKAIGYKVYQKFEAENLNKKVIDDYIKEALATGEYSQKGKQKAAAKQRPLLRSKVEEDVSEVEKNRRNYRKFGHDVNYKKPLQSEQLEKPTFMNLVSEKEQNAIRQSKAYNETVEKYGKDFAEAVYFLTRVK